MNGRFTETPPPHYYAVIFSSILSEDDDGYGAMGDKMFELALEQPGCYGAETARDEERFGITVSYWKDEESISAWKANAKHLVAQNAGIERWYSHYELRIARVDRAYSGPKGRSVK